ncbi:MAG: adenine deaminase [Kiritimatiellae bacterium]|nr:adenine deaminase [Kiritimatiellia bacterium]
MELLQRRLAAARGDELCDLVIENASVVNVLTGELESVSVGVCEGIIVGLGQYAGRERVDAAGQFLVPGLIDAHLHIESTLLSPGEFARAVVPRGTTAVIADPHEIANVHGVEGVRWMLRAARDLPLEVFVMLPSCVPATPWESAGASLDAAMLAPLLAEPGVLGIGEMMNFPALIAGDPEMLRRVALAGERVADGHAPGVRGPALNAYLLAGAATDHESTSLEEAREKLRRGMHLHLREGSSEHNLAELAAVVTPLSSERCSLASDDRHPDDLIRYGHMDHAVRTAIRAGIPPLTAIRLATWTAARRYGLRRLGAIAPGYQADFFLTDSLESCRPSLVFKRGRVVASDGHCVAHIPPTPPPPSAALKVAPFDAASFAIPADRPRRVRVIELVPGQIVTRSTIAEAPVVGSRLSADPGRDLVKLAVIERHRGSGRIGLGFVRGFGFRRGAIAGTVAHDAHNLIAAGVRDEDIAAAAAACVDMGGGLAVAADGGTLARLPLPIAGLMSDRPLHEVVRAQERLLDAARSLGGSLDNPFMALSFLSLTPIPELRLTDRGLFDSVSFRPVPLVID